MRLGLIGKVRLWFAMWFFDVGFVKHYPRELRGMRSFRRERIRARKKYVTQWCRDRGYIR